MCGTPDDVVEQIAAFDEFGIDEFRLRFPSAIRGVRGGSRTRWRDRVTTARLRRQNFAQDASQIGELDMANYDTRIRGGEVLIHGEFLPAGGLSSLGTARRYIPGVAQ